MTKELRPDLKVVAGEGDVAAPVWTDFVAEGVEGHLQHRRESNHHGRLMLHVYAPSELEYDRNESLENSAKASVGKACYVNV